MAGIIKKIRRKQMKNTSKILSVVLLLSFVLSVFAVIPAFATEADAVTTNGANDTDTTIKYDMSTVGNRYGFLMPYSSASFAGPAGSEFSAYPYAARRSAANGVVYFNLGFDGWADVNTPYTSTSAFNRINPGGVYAGEDKDSDYLILDFDYAIDGTEPRASVKIQERLG